jgi:hypothetical protein
MESIAPAKLAPEPPAQQVQNAPETKPPPAQPSVQLHEQAAAAHANLAPNKLIVQMDAEAGRFVHTLTDPESQETLWRYPSEAQLAYSRAVMTYVRAMASG